MKETQKIQFDILINPNNSNESVMVFKENIIDGWGFDDYVKKGALILTKDCLKEDLKVKSIMKGLGQAKAIKEGKIKAQSFEDAIRGL